MEIFNKSNSRNTGKLEILTSHMLISPQNSSTKNLSIQISTIPKGLEQPIHEHDPEQCYYIIKGTGLMIIEDETREVTSGDAIYIPSNKNHGIKNIGDEVLEYLLRTAKAMQRNHTVIASVYGLFMVTMYCITYVVFYNSKFASLH